MDRRSNHAHRGACGLARARMAARSDKSPRPSRAAVGDILVVDHRSSRSARHAAVHPHDRTSRGLRGRLVRERVGVRLRAPAAVGVASAVAGSPVRASSDEEECGEGTVHASIVPARHAGHHRSPSRPGVLGEGFADFVVDAGTVHALSPVVSACGRASRRSNDAGDRDGVRRGGRVVSRLDSEPGRRRSRVAPRTRRASGSSSAFSGGGLLIDACGWALEQSARSDAFAVGFTSLDASARSFRSSRCGRSSSSACTLAREGRRPRRARWPWRCSPGVSCGFTATATSAST